MNFAFSNNDICLSFKNKKSSTSLNADKTNEFCDYDTIQFKNPEHNSLLMKSFIKMKCNKELCDVVLIIGEQTIECHKIILASLSPYFRTMFTNGMSESRSQMVHLNDISFKIVNQLIDEYFYNGSLTIEQQNVEHLFNVSCLFQITSVINACCEFFKRNITSFNCVEIIELAEMHSCDNLFEYAIVYTAKNLPKIISNHSINSISITNLMLILEKRDLFNEYMVDECLFEGLIEWTKFDLVNRKEFLPQLLSFINMDSFSKEFLIDNVAREEILRYNEDCSQFVLKAVEKYLKPHKNFDFFNYKHVKASSYLKRVIKSSPDIIVCGGVSKNSTSKTAESFCTQQNKWLPIASMIHPRWGAGLSCCLEHIYVVGGSNDTGRLSSVERYDIYTNVWLPAPNLLTARNGVTLNTINDSIYAIGGFDGFTPLKSVEVYNPKLGKWSYSNPLTIPRFSHASVVFNNKLYCSGGSDGHVLNCFECFDPISNSWVKKCSMNMARKQHALVATEQYIYAIGGYGTKKRLNTVERYCPIEDKWIFVSPISRCLSGSSASYYEGFIYVFGGHDDNNVVSTVERYDPISDEWMECLPMLQQRDRSASSLVNF